MSLDCLFQPFQFKSLKLPNRLVMAPMTRSFSPGGVPTAQVAQYYERRAKAAVGLIISEGTVVNRPSSSNDPNVPRFWGDDALPAWKKVIDSVHAAGGVMAPQLWHMGATRNRRLQWDVPGPIDCPSGLSSPGKNYGDAMTDAAIADTIAAFAQAAADAQTLGFDAIELHGAHGYLIDQFLWDGTNQRSDRFGGKTLVGDRKKLLDLAIQNVRQYKLDKLKQEEKLNPDQRAMQMMKSIQELLHIDKPPMTIECFDNSNISGSDAVAACVVFKKGKPSKKDYRKYNIKTVVGPDDYASMKEVVRRRYTRMLNEETPLPDLIIADGGVGQMEVIRQVIEDELKINIPIAGLAKDSKHHTRELLFGFPPKEIGLKINDPLFKLLASMQDEVHRFAITFHRDKRSKKQVASELDTISGIGEKTKNDLIKHFKSLKRIKSAELSDLVEIIGTSRASTVYNYFKGI